MLIPENIKAFENKVYVTRKCRIESSERLIETDKKFQFFINYYAVFIAALSIIGLKYTTVSDMISIGSTIASIALLVISVYFSGCNYSVRSMQLKHCYIELDVLLGKVAEISRNSDQRTNEELENEFNSIQREYADILSKVENHITIDLLRAKKNMGTLTEFERLQLIWEVVKSRILGFVTIIWPLIVIILILYKV